MRALLRAAVALTLLLFTTAAFAQAARTIRYDGRLERNGAPADGGFDLGFALFDASAAGNQLWPAAAGEFATVRVNVSNGQFVVELGGQGMEPLGWQVFAAPQVFVATKVSGTLLVGRRAVGAVPFAVQADNGVPVGGLVMWWRPNAQFAIPEGFAIADGRVVNDPLSPLNGTALPDMMDRALIALPEGRNGEKGGSWSGRTNGSGNIQTTDAGGHQHNWGETANGGWTLYSNQLGGWVNVFGGHDGIHLDGSGMRPLGVAGADRVLFQTDGNGNHAHIVPDHAHNYDKLVPYIGLLPLIRTR